MNIAGGVTGSFIDRDREFFHQGNAIWNSVDLAIAIAGVAGNARKRSPPDSCLDESRGTGNSVAGHRKM